MLYFIILCGGCPLVVRVLKRDVCIFFVEVNFFLLFPAVVLFPRLSSRGCAPAAWPGLPCPEPEEEEAHLRLRNRRNRNLRKLQFASLWKPFGINFHSMCLFLGERFRIHEQFSLGAFLVSPTRVSEQSDISIYHRT